MDVIKAFFLGIRESIHVYQVIFPTSREDNAYYAGRKLARRFMLLE